MVGQTVSAQNNVTTGVVFITVAMIGISINDVLIKLMSDTYPLHQMVFARSAIGIVFTLAIVQFEGGWRILRTDQPGLHLLRGLLIVIANMAFFAALAVIPLGEATALFFVAPLFITLLSIPILGEKVGPRRIVAVLIGFCGVLLMMRPGVPQSTAAPDRLVLLLPVAAALAYACMQMLTRRLGVSSKASAMAVYIQCTFIAVSLAFWMIAGDGRYADGVENESILFLLRAWRWPSGNDLWLFLALGVDSAVVGYSLSQAYRSADAATVAPFEYVALPLAVLWGWLLWNETPDVWATVGIAFIMAAGLYVYVREKVRRRPVASQRTARRW